MPIIVKENLFTLNTKNTTYQFKVGDFGYLYHLYYGPRLFDEDMSYVIIPREQGFSGVCYDAKMIRNISMDLMPQEYPSTGVGDFRFSALGIINNDGSRLVDLRFYRYEILETKPKVKGMPCFRETNECLKVVLKDRYKDIYVELLYSIYPENDLITRSVIILNKTKENIILDKAMSVSFDMQSNEEYELLSFYGAHVKERMLERQIIKHSAYEIGSNRGTSSHQQNPFVIIASKNANEDKGEAYIFSLVYSGSHLFHIERNIYDQIRIAIGISPEGFRYNVASNEAFYTPEVAFGYSNTGFSSLTNNWHKAISKHLINPRFKDYYSPILINNWEATYMDFTEEKLLNLAKKAKSLGIEMLVMDDGWFKNRLSDISGLGDWEVNTDKFPNGLSSFVDKIHNLGMKFGLWFEPEMISEKSDLYEKHKEWVLMAPNREPMRSRYQLVLDLSNDAVIDYIYDKMAKIISETNLEYIKWDMNRSISDVFSNNLPIERQGEVLHRYVLGLYKLLERLTTDFPDLIIEGCSGGGGRFDLGMLYYEPQIWTSDNTDAYERLFIHYGTSFGYPIRTMGAHVSAVPNHQTGRVTPLKTRGIVASHGTFGYELDLLKLSKLEQQEIKNQIKEYVKHRKIIYNGNYYRLSSPYENDFYTSYQFQFGNSGLLYVCFTKIKVAAPQIFIRLKGLDKMGHYKIDNKVYSGLQLMQIGLPIKAPIIDYDSLCLEIKKVRK